MIAMIAMTMTMTTIIMIIMVTLSIICSIKFRGTQISDWLLEQKDTKKKQEGAVMTR